MHEKDFHSKNLVGPPKLAYCASLSTWHFLKSHFELLSIKKHIALYVRRSRSREEETIDEVNLEIDNDYLDGAGRRLVNAVTSTRRTTAFVARFPVRTLTLSVAVKYHFAATTGSKVGRPKATLSTFL